HQGQHAAQDQAGQPAERGAGRRAVLRLRAEVGTDLVEARGRAGRVAARAVVLGVAGAVGLVLEQLGDRRTAVGHRFGRARDGERRRLDGGLLRRGDLVLQVLRLVDEAVLLRLQEVLLARRRRLGLLEDLRVLVLDVVLLLLQRGDRAV